ncbi:ZinT/AdcA family metal-binding protein [Amygdalobacter nucleatus]|uniref:ZinT domain-containing protein n=1 Tax=Amygdalobacter nucleatus TaxID=3029274 RepID=A0A133YEB4_9FIRM|nr:ZinT/AdcA family metal-binding protein [Amygdalobacter nucleatus]KXB41550.1 hypothetical protein HMPREF1872_00638 [Amygdalobacter nucleatus]MDF0485611.1 ZinT/AdcA family metal-binding protein [Amygdalobacter nucleatus]WEG36536.1 ZinT/AdcA family metal-binding protein [Amygdalobacter nucleatus]
MKKHIALALSLVLTASLFAACSKQEAKPTKAAKETKAAESVAATKAESKETKSSEADKKPAKAEEVSLEDWKGTWNSIEGYYDEPEVKKAMEEKAKEIKKKFDDLKAEKSKECHVDWLGLKIDGKTITFLDNFASKNGKELEKVEYVFKEMKQVGKEGEEHSKWAVFEAKDKNAKHPLLLMMPVHGEDEITHFHIRYGKSVDEMLKMDEWWPVMAKDSSTMEQVITEVTH